MEATTTQMSSALSSPGSSFSSCTVNSLISDCVQLALYSEAFSLLGKYMPTSWDPSQIQEDMAWKLCSKHRIYIMLITFGDCSMSDEQPELFWQTGSFSCSFIYLCAPAWYWCSCDQAWTFVAFSGMLFGWTKTSCKYTKLFVLASMQLSASPTERPSRPCAQGIHEINKA
jgi:hypothetical protein